MKILSESIYKKKMLDFSGPKPNFNYVLGYIEDKPVNKNNYLEEVSTEEIKRRIKNKQYVVFYIFISKEG